MTATKALAKTAAKPVKAQKRGRGRPTTYKPEYGEQIRAGMAQGLSLTAAAAELDLDRDNVYRWAGKYPDFDGIIRMGRFKRQAFLEKRLIGATQSPIVTSSIFALKNAAPQDWSDRQDLNVNHSGSIAVETDGRQLGRAVIEILAQGRTIPGVSADITDITPDGETVDTDE